MLITKHQRGLSLYRHLLKLALSLLLAGCQIDIMRHAPFLCNKLHDCSSGFVCQANPAAEVKVRLILRKRGTGNESVLPTPQILPMYLMSRTSRSSDLRYVGPSDSSETGDPTDPASGCATHLPSIEHTRILYLR